MSGRPYAAAANEEHRHQCADLNDERRPCAAQDADAEDPSSSHRQQDDATPGGCPEDRPEGVVEGFVSVRRKEETC